MIPPASSSTINPAAAQQQQGRVEFVLTLASFLWLSSFRGRPLALTIASAGSASVSGSVAATKPLIEATSSSRSAASRASLSDRRLRSRVDGGQRRDHLFPRRLFRLPPEHLVRGRFRQTGSMPRMLDSALGETVSVVCSSCLACERVSSSFFTRYFSSDRAVSAAIALADLLAHLPHDRLPTRAAAAPGLSTNSSVFIATASLSSHSGRGIACVEGPVLGSACSGSVTPRCSDPRSVSQVPLFVAHQADFFHADARARVERGDDKLVP